MIPMMSMIESLVHFNWTRDAYLFYALRHSRDHIFKSRLQTIARQFPRIRMVVLDEQLGDPGELGTDCDYAGRINMTLLRTVLPHLDMEYYVCGPGAMMTAVCKDLAQAGVPQCKIQTESFGTSNFAAGTRPSNVTIRCPEQIVM